MNRAIFFNRVRPLFVGGRITQAQVSGTEHILAAWDAGPWSDPRWLAYCLATTFHETAQTMQPIRERGGSAYFHRMYDPESPDPGRARLAQRMAAQPGDGVRFPGRGYVQLTWRVNYERASAKLGVDLVAGPDKAMDPTIAARIMFEGMASGWFTGRRLGDYFTDTGSDWVNARRIINGLDCASQIAKVGRGFHAAIEAAL